MPQPAGHSPQTVAYQVATPGTTSSGGTTYGISCSAGMGAHAVIAAAGAELPSTFRNVRRPTVRVSVSSEPTSLVSAGTRCAPSVIRLL